MATTVTFSGVNYSVPAANEEDWQSLSNYLIALANAVPAGGPVSSNIRVSTTATTSVATTDYAVLINYAGAAVVNLPVGVDKQIFVIADVSGAASTNNITINRGGSNTILGGTSYVLDRNNQIIILGFSGGNWYRIGESLPKAVTSPASTTAGGIMAFQDTAGKFAQDLGVGTANDVLKTDGTTPAFGKIVNANIDPAAAISYSKLNLSNSIVNADISGSASIAYSKLNLVGSITNADVNAAAGIAYSKLNLTNSIVDADIKATAAISYSKLNLSGAITNSDINAAAAIAYSKLNLTNTLVDADINASAAISYSKLNLTNSIVDADIKASAAITRSKIASGSANHVVVNDGSGVLSSVAVLPIAQGGTGLSTLGTALQFIRVNATETGLEYATVSGLGDVSGPPSSVTNGIVQFSSTTGKVIKDLGVGSANQVLLTDGTSPSFGAITNAYIDPAAAIARTKLASGTASHVLINDGSGVMSSEATLATSRGGTGVNSTATFPSSGVVVTEAGSQTLTNKTIDADLNTISNIADANIKTGAAIARSKLASGTADHVIINDGSGALSSEATLATSRGGTGVSSTATFPTSGVVVTEAGTQTLTNKTLTSALMQRMRIADAIVTSAGPALALQATVTTYRLQSGFGATLSTITGASDGDYVVIINETGGNLTVNSGIGTNAINTGTGSAIILQNGAALSLVFDATNNSYWNVVGGAGGGGLIPLEVSSTVASAVPGRMYLADTTGGAFQITLPSGSAGSVIGITDSRDNFGIANLTIAPASGQKLDGYAIDETLVMDQSGAWIILTWDVSGTRWVIQSSAPGSSATAIVDGGNTLGRAITIGTNDNFGFNIETNGTVDFAISNTGAVTVGPTTGIGNAYHTFIGTTVLRRVGSGAQAVNGEIASENAIQLYSNGYYDSITLTRKALTTQTGTARLLVTSNATNYLEFFANNTDAQTAGSNWVNTNEKSVFSITGAGAITLGASGGTAIHQINTAALTTSTAAGISYLRININGTVRRIPTYNDA